MNFVIALGGLGLLLLSGLVLRAKVAHLRRLLLPVSVIGGFVGLGLGPYSVDWIPSDTLSVWSALPGILINLVFASLFLGVSIPPASELVRQGGPLFRFSAVMALGQYVVGLLLTGLVLMPVFGTPELFACLLEVGFAGGHGTAAAMGPVFADLGFPAGAALGQMSATVGIVVAVVSGVGLIQWGARNGHASQISHTSDGFRVEDTPALLAAHERGPIAHGTVRAAAIDTFTLHVAVVAVAVLAGWGMQVGLRSLHSALSGFPLFPLAMIGGMLVQFSAVRIGVDAYFDRATFQRIMGLSLDLLIVSAIASLRLDLFLQNVVPFSLLMVVGVAWVVFAFIVLAPRILEGHWFEKSITAYGTMTGVTAMGLMLLRISDPDTRTPATEAFAASMIVISPLVGGGIVTATVPLFVQGFGWFPVLAVMALLVALLFFWPRRRAADGPPTVETAPA